MTKQNPHTILSARRFCALLLVVLFGALGFLAFSLRGGWHEVVTSNVRAGFPGVALMLSFSPVNSTGFECM